MQRGLLAFLLMTWGTFLQASEQAAELPVLSTFPKCVESRLPQVRASVGIREPDLRTGMVPVGVSYRRVFDQLLEPAAETEADAVVLRSHQADYFVKGTKPRKRPTYIQLLGTPVRLKDDRRDCPLAAIDLAEFEHNALQRERSEGAANTGFYL